MATLPEFIYVGSSRGSESRIFSVVGWYARWKNGEQKDLPWTQGEKQEFREDNALRDIALNWAKSNPVRIIQLAGIKFSRMWDVVPNEPMFSSWGMKLIVAVTFTPLFLLGLYGVTKFTWLGWPYLLAGLPALYFTLLHVVFVASIRYREPAMLGLIVLASGVVAQRLWGDPTAARWSLIAGGKSAAG